MLNQILNRLSGKFVPFTTAADSSQQVSTRTEICPPALRRGTSASGWQESWQAGLRDWLQSAWPTSTLGSAGSESRRSAWPKELAMTLQSSTPLSMVRREFIDSLRDVRTQQAGDLVSRIRVARSMRELWHLRTDIYNLVARHRDELEATYRLNRLNRFFPQRVGRPSIGTLSASAERRSPARRTYP